MTKEKIAQFAQDHNRPWTFDNCVAGLEQICNAEVPQLPESLDGPQSLGMDPETRLWHASRILRAIQSVRDALQCGDATGAAASAVDVGLLVSEADRRLFDWPDLQKWIRYCGRQSARAEKGVVAKREDRTKQDADLLRDVEKVRAANPGITDRSIARKLSVGRSVSIDAMSKRIARANARK